MLLLQTSFDENIQWEETETRIKIKRSLLIQNVHNEIKTLHP
jgi:hypothetical protein